jgi:hypothetical protein
VRPLLARAVDRGDLVVEVDFGLTRVGQRPESLPDATETYTGSDRARGQSSASLS